MAADGCTSVLEYLEEKLIKIFKLDKKRLDL